jgi:hypothetical protein
MSGTCTGTVYTADNVDVGARMENSSTGGKMHTRSTSNASGAKARRVGDTILNTAPWATGTFAWVRIADGTGLTTSDLQRVVLAN